MHLSTHIYVLYLSAYSQSIFSDLLPKSFRSNAFQLRQRQVKAPRRPVWMKKVKLKHKKEDYRGWNQGQIAWDEYREIS